MALYLGFYRQQPEFGRELAARARAEGLSPDPKFGRLVAELPTKLPRSCRLLGSYTTTGGLPHSGESLPSVMIVETERTDDLFFIGQYYAGYLEFRWAPARSVGTTAQEREAAQATAAAPAGRSR